MTDRSEPGQADVNFHSTFGDTLRALRETAKYSQRDLAEVSGIDHSTVSRVESGTRFPTLETAVRLAIATGATPKVRLSLYESVLTKNGLEQQADQAGLTTTPDQQPQ